jgi:hypothetical protein
MLLDIIIHLFITALFIIGVRKAQNNIVKAACLLFSISLSVTLVINIYKTPYIERSIKIVFDCKAKTVKQAWLIHKGKSYSLSASELLSLQGTICKSERYYNTGRISTYDEWELIYKGNDNRLVSISLVKSHENVKIFFAISGLFVPAYSNSELEGLLNAIEYRK